MKSYIGIDSKAKDVKAAYIGVDGEAKKIFKGYIGVDGLAKPFYFDLDAAFQRVQYLTAATAGPYITLPITTQEGLKLSFEVGWVGSGASSYMGCSLSNNRAQEFRLRKKDGALIRAEGQVYIPRTNSNDYVAGTISGSALVSVQVDFGNYPSSTATTLTVGSDSSSSTRVAMASTGNSMGLFAAFNTSTPTPHVGCFGEIKAYDASDNLIMDFVPVVKRTGSVPGFYDLVSMQFYTNEGTGSFTAGPDVT